MPGLHSSWSAVIKEDGQGAPAKGDRTLPAWATCDPEALSGAHPATLSNLGGCFWCPKVQ